MKNYKLTIPKPCHEGWEKMTPNEKGRFCDLCSKTVVDFTKKSPEEIQSYFIANSGSRICGHFKRSQLDSIVIQIPDASFREQLSFQKMFVLVLVLTMGTMLFSCKTDTGKTQKIDKVEVIDSISNQVIDSLTLQDKVLKPQKDSICTIKSTKSCVTKKDTSDIKNTVIKDTGEVESYIEDHVVEGMADVASPSSEQVEEFNIEKVQEVEIEDIKDIELEGDVVVGMPASLVEELPKFKGSTSDNFQKDVGAYVIKILQKGHFLASLNSGTYKFEVNFFTSKKGTFTKITLTTSNKIIKNIIIDILTNAPKVIPAKQNGVPREVKYKLPLTLVIE